jgi:hypothetical protein
VKRFAIIATAIVGIATGIAACADGPAAPKRQPPAVTSEPSFFHAGSETDVTTCKAILDPEITGEQASALCNSFLFRAALCGVLVGAQETGGFSKSVRVRGVMYTLVATMSEDTGNVTVVVTETPPGGVTKTYTVVAAPSEIATLCHYTA